MRYTKPIQLPGRGRIRASVSVIALAAAGVLLNSSALAQAVPRIPRTALPSNMSVVAGNFGANVQSGTASRPVLAISQKSNSGILSWNSFDIGADATVNISQPSATATLLNKVLGGAYLDRTTIEGMLNANGQVYIYNPNGVIFGKTAQVNLGSLVATTLKIDDNRFLSGLTAPNTAPIFAADASLALPPGAIVVEGESVNGILQQAGITAAKGGRILLVAPQVSNSGKLVAPDGQVILIGANSGVFLDNPADTSMRGLRAEVSDTQSGASAVNATLGQIDVGRGNVTLAALAVNQDGIIKASTSVNLNGSIYLKAQGGAAKSASSSEPRASVGGILTLGAGSKTLVDPDVAEKTSAPDDPAFKPSQVFLSGASITLEDKAAVIAKSGDVRLSAGANPSEVAVGSSSGGVITLKSGALIDVSGTTDTSLAMESNVIEVELRSQLADNPLLRNSSLRGRKVKVDVRKGTKIANLSDDLNAVQRTIGERTAGGGTVTMQAGDAVAAAAGSIIDLSGGKVSYQDGYVATSKLTYKGSTFDIGSASAGLAYDGVIDQANPSRPYEAGYEQGYDAGTLAVSGKSIILGSELKGSVFVGARQRDPGRTSASSGFALGYEVDSSGKRVRYAADRLRPLGGRLDIGNLDTGLSDGRPDFSREFGYEGHIVLGADPAASSTGQLNLDVARLAAGGISRIRALTKNSVRVAEDVALDPGGEILIGAQNQVVIDANITSAGGKVTAMAGDSLSVGDGAVIDLSGRWTNDRGVTSPPRDAAGNPTTPVVLKGGALALSGNRLDIGDAVNMDVSGGAWLDSLRKLSKGSGGSIALDAFTKNGSGSDSALVFGDGLRLAGYGFSAGGSLKLTGREVSIGDTNPNPGGNPDDLFLPTQFFAQGGFTRYTISALRNLTLTDHSVLNLRADTWLPRRSYELIASGEMDPFASVARLDLSGPNAGRPATSLVLAAPATDQDGIGRVVLGTDSTIDADPGAKISLAAGRQLTVNATLNAPGGVISAGLTQTAPSSTDSNYRAERTIWFGKDAKLLAKGTAELLQTGGAIPSGEVLGGGTIQVGQVDRNGSYTGSSAVGYVVAESGSVFDVSGTEAGGVIADAKRFNSAPQAVASDGGSIEFRAREGLLLAGELVGRAGGQSARNGSLSISLDRENAAGAAGTATGTYPQQERKLVVVGDDSAAIVPDGLLPDQEITGIAGTGRIRAGQIASGGFDRLSLKSQNVLAFEQGNAGLNLSAAASLILDAPALQTADQGTVGLSSAYVRLGSSDARYQAATPAANAGSAKLDILARSVDDAQGTVDLIGKSVLQGFGSADISAVADVRLTGVPVLTSIRAPGSFAMAGNMTITTGQTYVSTLSDFRLVAQGSLLTFASNGRAAPTPLSAAGVLSVEANEIQQDGVVRAPFGSITLDAGSLLAFGPDSLTSVAGGSSPTPFGYVQNGNDWLYDYGNGRIVRITATPRSGSDLPEMALPEKVIVARAPVIKHAAKATLDLAGGGELYGYQFTPGPGGSKDVLAKSSTATGANQTFAVLPGFSGGIAPADPQYGLDGGLLAGDSVFLSGAPGLPAGIYTLLPAHYALLKGAFAVTAVAGARDMLPAGNSLLTDGSQLVAGYALNAGSGHGDTRWSGFNVQSSAQVRNRSEFADFYASEFFAAKAAASNVAAPRLPLDGGRVAFDAGTGLTLAGAIRLNAASGGRRGDADISADEIHLLGTAGEATGSGLNILASDLATIGAESLLLGGLRERGDDGVVRVHVGAEFLTVGNDAGHPATVAGKDLILVANDTLTVKAGATITGSGYPATAPADLSILGSGTTASGALLRVTGKGNAGVIRDNPGTAKGTLSFDAGSSVSASGAVVLDATKDTLFAGAFDVGQGAALTLGARRISLGDGIPTDTEGLRFDSNGIKALNKLTNLSLTSYQTLDLYGKVSLGGSDMELILGGQGIQGYGTRQAAITAKSLRFNGGSGFDLQHAAPATAAGKLDVTATDIRFGSNVFQVRGFSSTDIEATREARGEGGSFINDSALKLTAGRITAASGSESTVSSAAKLTLAQSETPAAYNGNSPLGGKLHFTGNSIDSSALVEVHAGSIDLAATNGVEISGGKLDASGVASAFGSRMAYAPGGSVNIDGGTGNVTLGDNASIDVSAVGASAGSLSVKASSGKFSATGQMSGGAAPGADGKVQTQGSFSLDVASFPLDANGLPLFGKLNSTLNTGGFTEARSFRLRSGSLALASTETSMETITAHEVRIAVDNGNLDIAGTINAYGAKGGTIELVASQTAAGGALGKVSIGSTAHLYANATETALSSAGSAGDGGRILITTGVTGTAAAGYADAAQPVGTNGGSSISLAAGAVLDVSGTGAGRGGSVRLRAPRTADNADVAVSTLAATVTGADETVVEGYKVYGSSSNVSIGTAADVVNNSVLQAATSSGAAAGKMYSEANSFLSATNKSAMQATSRLGTAFALQAGVEVRSAGNITVSVNESAANPQDRGWNLNTWRPGGAPGQLVLRAAGNLTVNGSISDGFAKPVYAASNSNKISLPGWDIAQNGASWSYGLAAGADLGSGYPLATKPSDSIGDFTLGFARTSTSGTDQAVALIRSGTGRIDIAAGRDVKLAILSAGSDNTGTTQSALGATIYTAGTPQALAAGFSAPTTGTRYTAWGSGSGSTDAKVVTPAFTDRGGGISIVASRDIVGASTPQLVNQWLFRQGNVINGDAGREFLLDELSSTRYNTAWWTRFDYFNENVATFGGGDVRASAGRNITDFSASVATNAYVPGTSPEGSSLVQQGGGDLRVRAGANISGGLFYVQKGSGVLDAGGAITYSVRTRGTGVPDPYPTGHPEDATPNAAETTLKIRPVLALGDGSFSVTGRGDVEIESVFNPTMVRQGTDNAAKYSSINSAPKTLSMFLTYGERSAVDVLSLAGDVHLVNDFEEMMSGAGKRLWDAARGGIESAYRPLWLMYPGTVNLQALNGDIEIQRGFTLAPSAHGNLSLLANGSVVFNSFFKSPVAATNMLDLDPAAVANVFAPRTTMPDAELKYFSSSIGGIAAHTQAGLHRDDPTTAVVHARNGNVTSNVADSIGGRALVVPKRLEVYAAGDIEDFGFAAQHFTVTDVSSLTAGGSIVDVTNPVRASVTQHTVSGPGRIEFVAGGNIDLGNGAGIVTRGNLDNPYLEGTGASVVLSSGILGADRAAFLRGVLGMTGSDAELGNHADANKTEVLDLFFAKLADVTGATGKQSLDLIAFDAVIASLFPPGSFRAGDINVFGSQVKTEQGGSIDLLAPGGSVYAGLASVPKYIADKPPSRLGIFTIKGGEIRSLVKQDFQVNQGRVFTLGGGDITLVSQYGNIDAGRGSKTAAATPPPILLADENGNAVLDISGSIAGSGIATLRAYDDTPTASVYPIAPRGIFDAGDAGLRSTGTVNIVAQTVLNAGNIASSGGTTGLAQTAGPVGPPPAPSSASLAAGTEEITKAIQQKDNLAASLLTVELLGFGGGDSQQTVTQAGQNSPLVESDDERKKNKSQ